METTRYTVLTPLLLDHRQHQPGEVVEIEDPDVAEELVEGGVVEPGGEGRPERSEGEERERLAYLVTTAARLDPSASDAWTKDGRPTTTALSRALEVAKGDERDVGAAERDQVWDLVTVCRSEPEARADEAEARAAEAEARAKTAEARAAAAEAKAAAAEAKAAAQAKTSTQAEPKTAKKD